MIRGPLRSRDMDDCVAEARWLASEGVKELIVVAQDPTAYGEDWGKPGSICALLDRLNAIEGIEWIRILYAYPERITDDFIAAMQRNSKVLPYLDLPIQHCNDEILHNMNRRSTKAELLDVIGRLRAAIPGITLRTTLIAGFPGETEAQFEELCGFVKQVEFDRLGLLCLLGRGEHPRRRHGGPAGRGDQEPPRRDRHGDPDRHHGPQAGRKGGPDPARAL